MTARRASDRDALFTHRDAVDSPVPPDEPVLFVVSRKPSALRSGVASDLNPPSLSSQITTA